MFWFILLYLAQYTSVYSLSGQSLKNSVLVLDQGNTFLKVALFRKGKIINQFENIEDAELLELIDTKTINGIMISDVSGKWNNRIQNHALLQNVVLLDQHTPVPFTNKYESPETLGTDRIAAVAGAMELYPDQHNLVIDAGTCITYDLITSDKIYEGGIISPGIKMRLKAMHSFTNALPNVRFEEEAPLFGKTTEQCMQSGVTQGVLREIEGIIAEYKQFFGKINIIVCGGHTKFFESKIKESIFAVPNLVLYGLYGIFKFNNAATIT